MAIEKTGIRATNIPNLAKEGNIYHNAAILALKQGYVPFTPHAKEYPYLGHLYREQIGPLGLIVVDHNGRTIIEPVSDVINLGLPQKDQAKLEEVKATGLFRAFMAASSCYGPFERRAPYWPRKLVLVGYTNTNFQPLLFGQYAYQDKALPPRSFVLNGMGFVIST